MTSRRAETYKRLRFDFGDPLFGTSWGEQYDTTGYIGPTMGPIKAPLLIHNRRSMGGTILDAENVVAIFWANKKDGRVRCGSTRPISPRRRCRPQADVL